MNVALKPELERFVEDQVKAGRYRSADEVFEAAVARLKLDNEAVANDGFAPGELDELIAVGEADIDRGDVSDAADVFARLRAKHAEFRRPSAGSGR